MKVDDNIKLKTRRETVKTLKKDYYLKNFKGKLEATNALIKNIQAKRMNNFEKNNSRSFEITF